jgi:dTDP-glucose 4,6-dehydratase
VEVKKLRVKRLGVLYISADEVFRSLEPTEPAFTESTLYALNSSYFESDASSEHIS